MGPRCQVQVRGSQLASSYSSYFNWTVNKQPVFKLAQTKHTHNTPNIISQIQYKAPIVQITYTLQALHIISSNIYKL